eukprot:322149-Rhodomonas_salina.1
MLQRLATLYGSRYPNTPELHATGTRVPQAGASDSDQRKCRITVRVGGVPTNTAITTQYLLLAAGKPIRERPKIPLARNS